MELTEEEKQLFNIYFIGIVSMARNHPGAGWSYRRSMDTGYMDKEWIGIPDMEGCANEALAMLTTRREVLEKV